MSKTISALEARAYVKQAFLDLLAQGGYGWSNINQACTYLSEKGHSCVFGLLVKRQHPEMRLVSLGGSAYTAIGRLESVYGYRWELEAKRLAQRAQAVHDAAAKNNPSGRPTLEALLQIPVDEIRVILKEIRDEQDDHCS